MGEIDERSKRLIARREQAASEREQLLAQRKAITDVAAEEAREDLSPEEDEEFRGLTSKIKDKDGEIRSYDERITELADEAERERSLTEGAAAVRRAQARAKVTEGRTYAQGNGNSYLRDLTMHSLNMGDDGTSERLRRHATEVATDKEFRADPLNRTDGTGGYFVPPLWLMDQFVELARPGRAYANVVGSQPLPAGTDSISVPRIATGTSTAIQTADNAAVDETSLTDDSISAPVRTIAGQQNLAVQLLDQSPVNFDQIVFRDLVADHATKVDLQVISGTGASGQVLGVRNTSDIETITAADDSGSVSDLYAKLADAVQRVQTQRYMPPTVIVMHPRRWAFFLAAVDGNKRPLVVPSAGNPQNAIATLGEVAAEQVVGHMHGLPVVTDPSLPTELNADPDAVPAVPGQDVIHVLRASDLMLYESSLRTRVLPEVGSGTLTVRLQVYNYLAFSAARYPKSIVEIGGAGLAKPSFGNTA